MKTTAQLVAAQLGNMILKPYEGAKEMLPVTILEDKELFQKMIIDMYPELPERKRKTKG